MLKLIPVKKTWFMAPMEQSLNGKGIMAPMEYTPIVYSRKNGKDMVLWNIFSRRVNGHGKRLKKNTV